MADISAYISVIENASRGEEVRDSIVNALIAINEGTAAPATPTSDGLMPASDKQKLNGIPSPVAADAGKFLHVDSSGAYELAVVPSAEEVRF